MDDSKVKVCWDALARKPVKMTTGEWLAALAGWLLAVGILTVLITHIVFAVVNRWG